jgi:hypothetical protein
MNPRAHPDQTAPRWRPDEHAAQAERLLARVWETVRRGDRGWDSPDIASMITAAEVHMRLAERTAPLRRTTPTGGSR